MRRHLPLLFLLLAAAGAAVWLALKPQAPATIRLPDGGVVTLRAVTSGRIHRQPVRNFRQRLAGWLPERAAKSLGLRRGHVFEPGFDALLVWTEWEGAVPNAGMQFVAVDEAGVESSPVFYMWDDLPALTGAVPVRGMVARGLRAWPRGAATFRLRLYGYSAARSTRVLMGEFVIPNPSRQSGPGWEAPALPATARAGGLSATLTRLEIRATRTNDGPAEPPWATAALHFTEDGAPATNWVASMIHMRDASGNESDSETLSARSEGTNLVVDFRWPLWAGEAWRFEVEFVRRSGFDPADVVAFASVPIPGRVPDLAMARTNQAHGHAVVLEGITDAEGRLARGTRPSFSGGDRSVEFRILPAPGAGLRVQPGRIIDDQGRPVREIGRGWGGGDYGYGLELEPDALRLDVELVLQKSRRLEFLVQPSLKRDGPGS